MAVHLPYHGTSTSSNPIGRCFCFGALLNTLASGTAMNLEAGSTEGGGDRDGNLGRVEVRGVPDKSTQPASG